MNLIFVVTLIFLKILQGSCQSSFQCYECKANNNDDICVKEPERMAETARSNCTSYCTILRTEFVTIPGQVTSFERSCVEKPLILNGLKIDAHYVHFYTSCTRQLCNDGDGVIVGGSDSEDAFDGIIRVPEKSSSTPTEVFNLLLIGALLISLRSADCIFGVG